MFGVYHADSLRSLNLAESVPPTPTLQEDHMSASVPRSTTVTPPATTTSASAIVTHIPSTGQSTTVHITDYSNTVHHTSSSTASGSSSTAEVRLQDSTCKCCRHACI